MRGFDIEVKVKKAHFQKGVLSDPHKCPVALAVVEAFERAFGRMNWRVAEILSLLHLYIPDRETIAVPLPDNAKDRIFAYETEDKAEPYAFQLRMPPKHVMGLK